MTPKNSISIDDAVSILNEEVGSDLLKLKGLPILEVLNKIFGHQAIIADFHYHCDRTNHESIVDPKGLKEGDPCPICNTPLKIMSFNRFVNASDHKDMRDSIETDYSIEREGNEV